MRYFAFGDTHGSFVLLMNSLKKAGFNLENPNDKLISLGDNFDRGSESKEMYLWLEEMKSKNKILFIRGNHENILLNYLVGKTDGYFDVKHNGLGETIKSLLEIEHNYLVLYEYSRIIKERYPEILNFLGEMPYGYKIGNVIFTHAGFAYDLNTKQWVVDDWANTPTFIGSCKSTRFKFVFGHWHARSLSVQFLKKPNEESRTFYYKNFMGLDSCTNQTMRVNIAILDSDAAPIPLDYGQSIKDIEKLL